MAGRMGWYRAVGVTLVFELVMRAILTIAGHHLHDNAFVDLNPLTYWFALFAICVASYYLILIRGYAMYRYIEQPSIACGKWIIAQRRKAAASAASLVVPAES